MEIKKLKELEERIDEREHMKTAFEYILRDKETKNLALSMNVSNPLLGPNEKRGGLYTGRLFEGYLRKSILINLPKLVEDAINLEQKEFECLKEDAIKEAIAVIRGDV